MRPPTLTAAWRQVEVHNVAADLSVLAQVESLAAELPQGFREARGPHGATRFLL